MASAAQLILRAQAAVVPPSTSLSRDGGESDPSTGRLTHRPHRPLGDSGDGLVSELESAFAAATRDDSVEAEHKKKQA